ncbi:MAG: TIGR00266 family protein [Pirellulaceae bacterium]
MEIKLNGNPDFGEAEVHLASGESILAEAGAMSRMSDGIDLTTKLLGGFTQSLLRKFLTQESLVMGRYTAQQPGYVALAPRYPGTVLQQQVSGQGLILTGGALLACSENLQIKPRFGGVRQIFSGEGAFIMQCTGDGSLVLAAYGAVVEKQVDRPFTVDTGHLVAWEPSLEYRIKGAGGIKQTLLSGEGLTMEFSGSGRIWLQSRNLGGFTHWLRKYC